MTEQNEPSMEAILASIRNILAEDEDDTPESASEAENAPAAEAALPENKQAKADEAPVQSEKQTAAQPADATPLAKAPEPEEPVLDLTAEMIVDEPRKAAPQPQEEKVSKAEEEEFMPEPVIPQEPMKEETLTDLIREKEEEEEDDFTPEPVIPQEPMKEETLTDLIKENTLRQAEDDMLLAEPTVMAATESLSHLRDIAAEKQLSLGNGALTIEAIVRETLKPYLKEWLDAHLPDIVERVVRKEVAHIMDRLDLK